VCEDAFRTGAVSVLVATQTVAAGVNLPAQRVIVRDPWVANPNNLLDHSTFRQMAGRAGRAGKDTRGEAIIIQDKQLDSRIRWLEGLLTQPVRRRRPRAQLQCACLTCPSLSPCSQQQAVDAW
jgi:replicative superfamily II helicase